MNIFSKNGHLVMVDDNSASISIVIGPLEDADENTNLRDVQCNTLIYSELIENEPDELVTEPGKIPGG